MEGTSSDDFVGRNDRSSFRGISSRGDRKLWPVIKDVGRSSSVAAVFTDRGREGDVALRRFSRGYSETRVLGGESSLV